MNDLALKMKCPHCDHFVFGDDALYNHIKGKHGRAKAKAICAPIVRAPREAEDDGSMVPAFQAMREHKRETHDKNLVQFHDSELFKSGRFVEHTPYHFSTKSHARHIDYWPSSGKWQIDKGSVKGGGLKRFGDTLNQLDKQAPPPPRRSRRHLGASERPLDGIDTFGHEDGTTFDNAAP